MKSKYALLFGALAIASATHASAATKVFNLTGATAFRKAAHSTIITMLGGPGVTTYAYTGTGDITDAPRAIFQGTMAEFAGDTIIVRCNWSGSTAGIAAVADATNVVQLLDGVGDAGTTMSTAGTRLGNTGEPAATTENAVARWSFSDVDKLLSSRPNAALSGGPVGVVPFMFLAGEGAPANITNMTDQIHRTLWSTGAVKVSLLTGSAADATLTAVATGRNNGSGTRATILAETGYGAFTAVKQYNATYVGTRTEAYPTAKLTAITNFSGGTNSGHSNNLLVREVLTRSSQDIDFNPSVAGVQGGFLVSYLTISDALDAITEGAKELTYNGVGYSETNVKNGNYSLWGYQQLYLANAPTADETTLDTKLRALVPVDLVSNNAGIPIPDMNVTRTGGDGGPIFPK